VKLLRFVGKAKKDLSGFPEKARVRAGYELFMVQVGRESNDWKPVPTVGAGAAEIRVKGNKRWGPK
jgi:phage-related protein